MSRSRASAKAAGSRWETATADYLRGEGWQWAERRAKTGNKDKGDIAGIGGPRGTVCIEAKDVAKITLAAFLAEAETERDNAGAAIGIAWIKRRGKSSPADGYAVCSGATMTQLLKEAGYQ